MEQQLCQQEEKIIELEERLTSIQRSLRNSKMQQGFVQL